MPVKIAIVDDHALVREGLRELLTSRPEVDVIGTAADGAAAVELAARLRPDVILLDMAMPGMDGLSAIARIRQSAPSTRIVILSMYDDPEHARAAIELGASGLVSKAAPPEELIAAVEAAAAGKTIAPPVELSPREREVLGRIARGEGNAEIAAALSIRPRTVEGYCESLMRKLDTHTRAGLVAHGRRLGVDRSN